MKKKLLGIAIGLIITLVFFVVVHTLLTLHWRHDFRKVADGRWECYKAIHFEAPGYNTVYHGGQDHNLNTWTTKTEGLMVRLKDPKATQEENEIAAGKFLLHAGIADEDCEWVKVDDHWHLKKPQSETQHFGWRAFYRVSSWQRDPENDQEN